MGLAPSLVGQIGPPSQARDQASLRVLLAPDVPVERGSDNPSQPPVTRITAFTFASPSIDRRPWPMRASESRAPGNIASKRIVSGSA